MCYHPPYKHKIWHYQTAKVEQTQQVIEVFSWEKSFRNLNISEMVSLFNRTIKNILSNYILHKAITFDGKIPSWINDNTKQLIQKKNNINKSYILSD